MLDENPLTPRINNLNNGASWRIGDVKHSFLTEAQFISEHDNTWQLCEGQSIVGTDLGVLTSWTNAPDPRGRFLRARDKGATGNNPDGELALGSTQDQATRKNGLTGSVNSTGSEHQHDFQMGSGNNNGGGYIAPASSVSGSAGTNQANNSVLSNTSSHSHGLTLGNGDNETRPKCMTINMYIKVNREPTI